MTSGEFGYNRKGNDAMSGVAGATTITPLTRAGSRRQQSGLATSGVVKIEDQQILLETVVDLFIKMMLTQYVCNHYHYHYHYHKRNIIVEMMMSRMLTLHFAYRSYLIFLSRFLSSDLLNTTNLHSLVLSLQLTAIPPSRMIFMQLEFVFLLY